MTELERLQAALIAADAAGNTADVAILSAELRRALAAQAGAAPQAPQAPQTGNPAMDMMRQAGLAGATMQGQSINPLDPVQGDPTGRVGQGLDIAASLGSGVARGAIGLAGLPGTAADLFDAGMSRVTGLPPLPTNIFSGASLQADADRLTGGATAYEPRSTAGEYAQTVGEFIPGGALSGGVVKFGVVPGLLSEGAGQAAEGRTIFGMDAEPWARLGGALVGPSIAAAGQGLLQRIISPNGGADPARLALAKLLDDYNVPVTAGQRVGNEQLQRRELMTRAGQSVIDAQDEAFTAAALATAGTTAQRATPEVLKATRERIGAVFDDVMAGVDITPTPQSVTAMRAATEEYRQLAAAREAVPAIGNIEREFIRAFRSGNAIPAVNALSWRSRLSKLTTSADQATREAAIGALDALDEAMSSSLAAAGQVDDMARLAEARGQYRNFLAIMRAASSAGQDAAVGLISPAQLRSAVSLQGRQSYALGNRGDIGELARAGVGVLEPPRNSGTPSGLQAMGVPQGVAATLGSNLGAGIGPGAGFLGGAIGAAVPAGMRALQASQIGQRYLANQAMGPGPGLLDRRMLSGLSGLLAQ